MTAFAAIARVTARGLVSRRRTILMVLLAAMPVLVGLLVRLGGRTVDTAGEIGNVLDLLVIRTVLPLLALVFGTAALGSELDDGTGIHLLTKPVARWRIVAAKTAVASGLTAALAVPAVLLTGLLALDLGGPGGRVVVSFAAAAIAGSVAYGALFVALGALTGRALLVGLIYVLLWEGSLAGLFEGAEALSVRQYVLAIAGESAGLEPVAGWILCALVTLLAGWLATARLARFEIRTAD